MPKKDHEPAAATKPAGDQDPDEAVDQPDSQLPDDFLETVLPPTSSYPPRYISAAIGIPIPIMDVARRAGELVASAGTHVDIRRTMVKGSDLILWIRRHAVAWKATEEGLRLYRQGKRERERRAGQARQETAKPKTGPTIVDRAEQVVGERTRRAEQEAEQERIRQAADYRHLLLIQSPDPTDVERLADLMEARALDVQEVRSDLQFLSEASQAQSRWDDREELEREAEKAKEAFRDAKREREIRHLTQGNDLETLTYIFPERTAMNQARARLNDARSQADTLKRLGRARPEFFDTTSDPPRLLG